MSFITIDQFTRELCFLTGEPGGNNYDAIIGHIRRGYSQIYMNNQPTIRSAVLPVDSKRCISWPDDCVKPLMTGLKRDGCNYVANLALDPDIYPGPYSNCSSVNEIESDVNGLLNNDLIPEFGFWYVNVFDGDMIFGELYGLGRGYNAAGFVKHDKENRMSYIRGCVRSDDKIVFCYKASGVMCGLEHIPEEVEEALKQYVLSSYYQISKPGVSADARVRFKEEITRLRKFNLAQTDEEWIQALTHNYKSSPK
jgi:hypothetical protein